MLLTGITGYLGSHIAQQLLERGYEVRGTLRSKSKAATLDFLPHKERLELFEADLHAPSTVWEAAAKGCQYVIHSASPFPVAAPKDENELIKPAVEGVTGVLAACRKVGGVKAVVVTSSIVAIMNYQHMDKVMDESDWANLDGNFAYAKSKVLAEKAAWDIYHDMKKSAAGTAFRMAVVNPGYIFGPALVKTDFASGEYVRKMLRGEMTVLPKLYFCVVDVRDVALAHILAMENPVSDGKRYACFSGEYMWVEDVAKTLKAEFGKYGYKIATETMKECPVKDKTDLAYVRWGRDFKLSNERIRKELGMKFRDMKKSLIEMAYAFVKFGVVPDLTHSK